MNRLFVPFVIALLCAQLPAAPPSGAYAPLIGVWQAVGVEAVGPKGVINTEWLGKEPTGVLIYDASGMMAVQLMRDPRPLKQGPEGGKPLDSEKAQFFDGYYAYFGRYEVDEKTHKVKHHIQGSLKPGEVGVTYTRTFELVGDSLSITTPEYEENGVKWFNRLRWKKVR